MGSSEKPQSLRCESVPEDTAAAEIEDRLNDPDRVARELQLRLGLKIDVRTVPLGSLPRFEDKGKRFHDQRQTSHQI
jgi:phenylacetate-CoA ligase